jgi:hypothetical protein
MVRACFIDEVLAGLRGEVPDTSLHVHHHCTPSPRWSATLVGTVSMAASLISPRGAPTADLVAAIRSEATQLACIINTDRCNGDGTHWRVLLLHRVGPESTVWGVLLADPAGPRLGAGFNTVWRAVHRNLHTLGHRLDCPDRPPANISVRTWLQRCDTSCGAVSLAIVLELTRTGTLREHQCLIPPTRLAEVSGLLAEAELRQAARMAALPPLVTDLDGAVLLD